jgi:hypothetical protein
MSDRVKGSGFTLIDGMKKGPKEMTLQDMAVEENKEDLRRQKEEWNNIGRDIKHKLDLCVDLKSTLEMVVNELGQVLNVDSVFILDFEQGMPIPINYCYTKSNNIIFLKGLCGGYNLSPALRAKLLEGVSVYINCIENDKEMETEFKNFAKIMGIKAIAMIPVVHESQETGERTLLSILGVCSGQDQSMNWWKQSRIYFLKDMATHITERIYKTKSINLAIESITSGFALPKAGNFRLFLAPTLVEIILKNLGRSLSIEDKNKAATFIHSCINFIISKAV